MLESSRTATRARSQRGMRHAERAGRASRATLVPVLVASLAQAVVPAVAAAQTAPGPGQPATSSPGAVSVRARPLPVYVLGVDSDDADDQADALGNALRSRIRATPAFSLQEASTSLGVLTAALRCPSHPDAPCLQRIGDQIHADRFFWGLESKTGPGRVTAEVHLWVRGRGDASARETYASNLRDANDDALRAIADRILERLTSEATVGTLSVHTGAGQGEVLVGGQRRGALEDGNASFDLPPGTYDVEVRARGYAPARQPITITAGQESSVVLHLARPAAGVEVQADRGVGPSTSGEGGGVSTRTVFGWSAIVVGAGFTVAAAVEGIRFFGLRSELNTDRSRIPRSISDVCAVDPSTSPDAAGACSKLGDAKSARTLGWVFTGIGALGVAGGIVLLATDPGHEAPHAGDTTAALKPRVVPYASPQGGGVDLSMRF